MQASRTVHASCRPRVRSLETAMKKLMSLLLILLVAGAAQALRRHALRDQRNRAAIERLYQNRTRPGSGASLRRRPDAPESRTRVRPQANERRRR